MSYEKIITGWVDLYVQRLVRLAYTYEHDWSIAEDRVQEAFFKAYQALGRFRKDSDPFPWLARIVINECKMNRRKKSPQVTSDMRSDSWHESAEDAFLQNIRHNALYQMVLQLPERLRSVIVLYYFEELSVSEIATVIGKSHGAVKSRLSRGREKLKQYMEGETYGNQIQDCKTIL